MKTGRELNEYLRGIEKKGYKAYKGIEGVYAFSDYELLVDHVQGDPFAAPSRIRIRVARKRSGFAPELTKNRSRRIALCDFLTRRFHENSIKFARGVRGSGKSGLITIDRPVQEILERTSMTVDDAFVEARFFMGLPAAGRRVAASDAAAMFFDEVPKIAAASLFMENLDRNAVFHHVETAEDADFLRAALPAMGLVGFVGDGSLLPRTSGIDPAPLAKGRAALFSSPERFSVSFDLPNRGTVSGMGIPRGVTLVVGGGYHGKSTLLSALATGIYNHLPGDGREMAVTVPSAVKIRAADGRNIEKVDISPFINNLPFKKDTRSFSTENASGSTSQAANILEAVEAGAELLLLDEDTSATNFMIRDWRMQKLVAKEKEPITPFIDKVRQLYRDKGVSTVLVMGGSGDYFSVADHVIQMSDYTPQDVTETARKIAEMRSEERANEGGEAFGKITVRSPQAQSLSPFRRNRKVKIGAPRLREILFGENVIDMGDVEQLIDISQTRAIAYAIARAREYMDGRRSLSEVAAMVMGEIDARGLDLLSPYVTGDLARFRGIELVAAINRARKVSMRQRG